MHKHVPIKTYFSVSGISIFLKQTMDQNIKHLMKLLLLVAMNHIMMEWDRNGACKEFLVLNCPKEGAVGHLP